MRGRGERDKEAKLLARAANFTITNCTRRYFIQGALEVMRFYTVPG